MISNTSEIVRPDNLLYSPEEIRELIILTRYSLYNRSAHCGAQAIARELQRLNIQPLPSLSLIGRILREYGLTYRRTGFY